MAETPETQQQPQPEAGIVQRYEPPPGAIPIARLKRAGIGLGLLALALLTLWGILHKPEAAATPRNAAAPVQPTTPMEVDSQQAELQREMQEARRAAEQAELAKQRAEHLSADPGAGGPRNAQADPDAQLRTQLRLEELRRRNQAAYASTIAFAPQGARPKLLRLHPLPATAPPAQAPAGPSDSKAGAIA